MNCEEVVELMQRELDGDLDSLEQERLREHLARCPDCAVLFSRLQKLSSELEQLPRVVPRYSLVDAILPQLERLEEAKDGRTETFGPAIPDRASVSAGPDPSAETAERSGDSESVRRTPERSRRFARDWWPRLASVAAFGVLIGVWLVNTPFSGPGLANRDHEAGPMAGAPSSGEAAELLGASAEPPVADGASPTGELKFDTLKVAPGAADDLNGYSLRDTSGRTGNPQAGSGNTDRSGNANHSGNTNHSGNADHSGGTGGDTPVSHEVSATRKITDHGREFSPNLEATPVDIFGLEHTPAEWVSPDGKWKVYAEDGVLKVAAAADGKVVYQSAVRNGAPADVEWQADGREIRVVWTDDAGETTVFVIDLATGEESHSGSEPETKSDGSERNDE